MRPNRLRERWSEGEPAAVGWMSTADGLIAETMAHAGFDVIVVDMQHGNGHRSGPSDSDDAGA